MLVVCRARGKAGKNASKTPIAALRHPSVILTFPRSIREQHVRDAFKKQVLEPTGGLDTATKKAGNVSKMPKTSMSSLRQARCFCSSRRIQTDFFAWEKLGAAPR